MREVQTEPLVYAREVMSSWLAKKASIAEMNSLDVERNGRSGRSPHAQQDVDRQLIESFVLQTL